MKNTYVIYFNGAPVSKIQGDRLQMSDNGTIIYEISTTSAVSDIVKAIVPNTHFIEVHKNGQ